MIGFNCKYYEAISKVRQQKVAVEVDLQNLAAEREQRSSDRRYHQILTPRYRRTTYHPQNCHRFHLPHLPLHHLTLQRPHHCCHCSCYRFLDCQEFGRQASSWTSLVD